MLFHTSSSRAPDVRAKLAITIVHKDLVLEPQAPRELDSGRASALRPQRSNTFFFKVRAGRPQRGKAQPSMLASREGAGPDDRDDVSNKSENEQHLFTIFPDHAQPIPRPSMTLVVGDVRRHHLPALGGVIPKLPHGKTSFASSQHYLRMRRRKWFSSRRAEKKRPDGCKPFARVFLDDA